MEIAIIDYGAGNVQSVLFALQRLGYNGKVTADGNVIRSADKVIFPGVGEASSAIQKLKENGLDLVIPKLQQPVLGICLGMQLLCKSSEEGNTTCLSVFDADVIRFPESVKTPQIGWNTIYNLESELFNGISDNEYMYLVHSYYIPKTTQAIAITDYEITYTSAIQKDNFFGVQFHPEKSGNAGEKIMENFLKLV